MDKFDVDIVFPGGSRIDADFGGKGITTGREGELSPFDLFLAGIGTCSAIKILRFCQERDIATEDIRIRQRMFHNPDSNMIEKIEYAIQLPPDFPKKYHKAVVQTAKSCGVKKHLVTPPEFDIHVTTELTKAIEEA
jgi:putative redox protein